MSEESWQSKWEMMEERILKLEETLRLKQQELNEQYAHAAELKRRLEGK